MADTNDYVSSQAAQDAMYAWLQEVDPAQAGVTFDKPREAFRPKSPGELLKDLAALEVAGRVKMRVRTIQGSRVGFAHYIWT